MWSNPGIANVLKLYRKTFKLFYKSHRVEQQKIRDCSVIINDFEKAWNSCKIIDAVQKMNK